VDSSNKDLMEVWRLLLKGALILAAVAAFLGGCTYFNSQFKLPQDHIAEEFLEDVIEVQLGLPEGSIDFTPNSK